MLKDARDYQILFLSAFLILGIGTRDWTLRIDLMLVVLLSCVLTQLFFTVLLPSLNHQRARYYPNSPNSPLPPSPRHPVTPSTPRDKYLAFSYKLLSPLRSSLITGLGLCLLLRANNWQTMAIAGCLAIASKFLFRHKNKHFFNPANFGIIAALLLTQDAWVSPGQWGTDWWYLLLFAGTGGMVLQKVGRWDTSAAFFGAYAGLEALRSLWLGQGWDVYFHHFTSGSLLLFALFMLTDPRSIPNARASRLIWAFGIAWLTFILQHQFYLSTAIFWALFVLSPLTIVLDSIWSAPRFTWQGKSLKTIAS
ncbi:RnfABCDGE type electron transport complex subunit D [Lusitaniella coriacea LEGE 07167]